MTDLEAILYRIEHLDSIKPAALDYGIFDDDGIIDNNLWAHLRDLFQQLWRAIANYADVETPGAHTVVAWTGNFSTILNATSPARLQSHQATLDAVLTRRATLLRILTAGLAVAAVPSNPFALLKLARELEAAVALIPPAPPSIAPDPAPLSSRSPQS